MRGMRECISKRPRMFCPTHTHTIPIHARMDGIIATAAATATAIKALNGENDSTFFFNTYLIFLPFFSTKKKEPHKLFRSLITFALAFSLRCCWFWWWCRYMLVIHSFFFSFFFSNHDLMGSIFLAHVILIFNAYTNRIFVAERIERMEQNKATRVFRGGRACWCG